MSIVVCGPHFRSALFNIMNRFLLPKDVVVKQMREAEGGPLLPKNRSRRRVGSPATPVSPGRSLPH